MYFEQDTLDITISNDKEQGTWLIDVQSDKPQVMTGCYKYTKLVSVSVGK